MKRIRERVGDEPRDSKVGMLPKKRREDSCLVLSASPFPLLQLTHDVHMAEEVGLPLPPTSP